MIYKNWKRRTCSLLLALLMLFIGLPAAAAEEAGGAPADYVQALSQLIAEYPEVPTADGFRAQSAEEAPGAYRTGRLLAKTTGGKIASAYGADVVLPLSENRYALQYETAQAAENACKLLEEDPNILYAEPDGVLKASAVSWGTPHIGADAFQAILPTKLPTINVAVLDTGLDVDHNHFAGRISTTRWNFIKDDKNITDDNGHGTLVSGIVTDSSSSNVKIMPLKVLDNKGNGYESLTLEAVRYAVDNGAKVVNMSLSGDRGSVNSWQDVVQYATKQGVTLFAATGNGEPGKNVLQYPAAISGIVAVTASTDTNYPAYFANYGSYVDFGAPGVDIECAYPGGYYVYASGTSMATPYASAAAALLLSHNSKLTSDDILFGLKSTCTPWAGSTNTKLHGAGVINITPRQEVKPASFSLTEGQSAVVESVIACPPVAGARFTYTSGSPAIVAVSQSGNVQALRTGDTTITVTGTGFRVEVPVTVRGSRPPVTGSDVTIKSVTLRSAPTKTVYAPGEALNTAGGMLRVTYSDGVTDDFPLQPAMCAGYDPNCLGTQTVTVDFSGKKLEFTVKVLPGDIPQNLALRYNQGYVFPYAQYTGVSWKSDNESVLTVNSDGSVAYKGRGSAVVTITQKHPGGRTEVIAQTQVTVTFTFAQWMMYIFLFGFLWM